MSWTNNNISLWTVLWVCWVVFLLLILPGLTHVVAFICKISWGMDSFVLRLSLSMWYFILGFIPRWSWGSKSMKVEAGTPLEPTLYHFHCIPSAKNLEILNYKLRHKFASLKISSWGIIPLWGIRTLPLPRRGLKILWPSFSLYHIPSYLGENYQDIWGWKALSYLGFET